MTERYFRFATPTYRFLHRPTVEAWQEQFLADEGLLSVPKAASVLLVWAQSHLYSVKGDRYVNGGDDEIRTSVMYCQKAQELLDHEPGKASLASVQSRLALCL